MVVAYTSSTANPKHDSMNYDTDFVDGKSMASLGALHYKHHNGEGKTLVFLHGLGGTMRVWHKLVPLLEYGLNVYLVDLMGHGGSDAPNINYTVKNQALAVSEFVKEQGLGEVYLIGHSYGAWIAAYYASQYSVNGIVLEDSAGLKEAFDQVVAMRRVQDYKKVFFKEAMGINNNKDYVIKSILDADFKEEELDDELLNKISAPTLIIWGRRDMILSTQIAETLHNKIKGSELVFIEDAGHDPHYSHPEEVAPKLMEFISVH